MHRVPATVALPVLALFLRCAPVLKGQKLGDPPRHQHQLCVGTARLRWRHSHAMPVCSESQWVFWDQRGLSGLMVDFLSQSPEVVPPRHLNLVFPLSIFLHLLTLLNRKIPCLPTIWP